MQNCWQNVANYPALNATHRLIWEAWTAHVSLTREEIRRRLWQEGFRPAGGTTVRRYQEQLTAMGVLALDGTPKMAPLYDSYLLVELPPARDPDALDRILVAHDQRVRGLVAVASSPDQEQQLQLFLEPGSRVALLDHLRNRLVQTRGTAEQLEQLQAGCRQVAADVRLFTAVSVHPVKPQAVVSNAA